MESSNDLPRFCPILQKEISEETCYYACIVAENTAPRWNLPQEFVMDKAQSDQCLHCENHIPD
jgi:hypothetical protein